HDEGIINDGHQRGVRLFQILHVRREECVRVSERAGCACALSDIALAASVSHSADPPQARAHLNRWALFTIISICQCPPGGRYLRSRSLDTTRVLHASTAKRHEERFPCFLVL